jgi:organic hydroperoxide reductase OsmC/OhrA
MTTFLAIAENSKFEFINFESNATGKLEKVDGKYLVSEITLNPVISISFEKDKEKALKLIEKSEAACLISNSIKSKIILNPKVKVLFESVDQ